MQLLNSHMQPNKYRVDFVLFYTSIYMCLHVIYYVLHAIINLSAQIS